MLKQQNLWKNIEIFSPIPLFRCASSGSAISMAFVDCGATNRHFLPSLILKIVRLTARMGVIIPATEPLKKDHHNVPLRFGCIFLGWCLDKGENFLIIIVAIFACLRFGLNSTGKLKWILLSNRLAAF